MLRGIGTFQSEISHREVHFARWFRVTWLTISRQLRLYGSERSPFSSIIMLVSWYGDTYHSFLVSSWWVYPEIYRDRILRPSFQHQSWFGDVAAGHHQNLLQLLLTAELLGSTVVITFNELLNIGEFDIIWKRLFYELRLP